MSDQLAGVLLGAAFSIPAGIFINIVSPRIMRRIDQRGDRASSERAKSDAKFEAEALRLSKDRNSLYTYLLETLLRVAYFGAIFGILSAGSAVIGQIVPYVGYLTQAIYALSQFLAVVGAIIVLNIARPAVQMVREINALAQK